MGRYMLDNRNKQLSIYCRWLGIYMLFVILGAMSFGTLGSLLKIIGFRDRFKFCVNVKN